MRRALATRIAPWETVAATTVILPPFDASDWLRLVEQHRGTRTFMVPAHFIRILEAPDELAARDHSSLQLIVHAGAPCPVPVKRRIIEALAPCEIAELCVELGGSLSGEQLEGSYAKIGTSKVSGGTTEPRITPRICTRSIRLCANSPSTRRPSSSDDFAGT